MVPRGRRGQRDQNRLLRFLRTNCLYRCWLFRRRLYRSSGLRSLTRCCCGRCSQRMRCPSFGGGVEDTSVVTLRDLSGLWPLAERSGFVNYEVAGSDDTQGFAFSVPFCGYTSQVRTTSMRTRRHFHKTQSRCTHENPSVSVVAGLERRVCEECGLVSVHLLEEAVIRGGVPLRRHEVDKLAETLQ